MVSFAAREEPASHFSQKRRAHLSNHFALPGGKGPNF